MSITVPDSRHRLGTVTAVNTGTGVATVDLGGGLTVTALALTADLPAVGWVVWLEHRGGRRADWVVTDVQSPVARGAARGLMAAPATNAAAQAAATTTELKDTGVGDYTFTAVAGRQYRVVYQCRIQSTVANDKADVRIRDGGASSPTNTSTLRAGAEITIGSATGGEHLVVTQVLTGLAAGTHIIAAFYVRAAGTGNVNVSNATGQTRELYVEDIGA